MFLLSFCRPAWFFVGISGIVGLLCTGCVKVEQTVDTAASSSSSSPTGSAGCGLGVEGVATSLEVEGETRTFELVVPDTYDWDNPYPLVFAWHGSGGTGQGAENYFGLTEAVGEDAIVVYPDGLVVEGGQTGWDLNPEGEDVQFFDAIRTHLLDNMCVDEDRIFVTGHSYGGYMSNFLGCKRPDSLSAVAPVAGGLTSYLCDEGVGVWLAHGTYDTTVLPSEGEAALELWAGLNGCDETYVDIDPSPCVAYEGCARDTHWCAHTGGHEWPYFAGEAIWDFFAAQ